MTAVLACVLVPPVSKRRIDDSKSVNHGKVEPSANRQQAPGLFIFRSSGVGSYCGLCYLELSSLRFWSNAW